MSRNVSLLNSVFASDAETVVPISPAVGIPYRNPNLTSGKAGQGWPFSTVVDSADFNELMFRVTGLMDFVEKTGGIIWSPLTDYPVGAFVRDEQLIFWEATQASGPNNGGSQNPYIGSQYWKVAEIGRVQDTNSITLSIVNQVLAATLRLAASSGLSVGADGVRVALNPSLTNAIKIVNGGLLVETVSGEDIRYMQQQTVFFDGTGVVCCGDWNIGEWEDSNEWPLIWDHGDLSIGKTAGFPDWSKAQIVKELPFIAVHSGFLIITSNIGSSKNCAYEINGITISQCEEGDNVIINTTIPINAGDSFNVVRPASFVLAADLSEVLPTNNIFIYYVPMIGPEDNMSTTIDCGEWNNEENNPSKQ